MDISYSKSSGNLYDLLTSLSICLNYDLYFKELGKYNIPEDKYLENMIEEIQALISEDRRKYEFYFSSIPRDDFNFSLSYAFLDYKVIWESNSLEDCLNKIEGIPEYDIKKRLLSFIDSYDEDWIHFKDEEKLDILIDNTDKFHKYLLEQPLSDGGKWKLLSFMSDINGHRNEYISLIKKYAPIYNEFIKKNEHEMDEFASRLEYEVTKNAFKAYIPMDQFIDLNNVDIVHVMPSFFHAYTISQNLVKAKRESYIVIGKNIDKIFGVSNRDSLVEKNIAVFKNLGDANRYKFIKLLAQGEKYGQEVADELNITSPSVSYHANNLLMANLLIMKRSENKTYYSLNKDTLRKMIDFIQKDLGL